MIERKNGDAGIKVFGIELITDDILFDFLLHIADEKLLFLSIPSCRLSDAGATILFEFLEDQHLLYGLKVYNNMFKLISHKLQTPYLLTGTL